MTNFDAVGPFFFAGEGTFAGFWVFCMRFCFFFPRDTPLTQQAVNCNEWSLIIAPLDPVSLYRKEIKKVFEDYGCLYFSFLLRGGGGYFEEGFHFGTLWYCYYFLLLHQHDADTGDHIEWSGWTTELHSMWSPVSVSHPCCWSPNKDCYNWGTWSPNKLITIPKHINDMEDLLSHPIWCLSLVAFASISLLLCFHFSFHFFPDSTNATYEKKQRGKQKPT